MGEFSNSATISQTSHKHVPSRRAYESLAQSPFQHHCEPEIDILSNELDQRLRSQDFYRDFSSESSATIVPTRIIKAPSEGGEAAPQEVKEVGKYKRYGWALEGAGLVLTTAALIALVVVLKRVDGQPLSSWNFPFSVNTVVSLLSISLRTPLAFAVGSCLGQGKWTWFRKRQGPLFGFVAFDEASRGPLGCVSLLWWLKSRHWASLGAWVTLTLLAMDPFLQAVILYEGQLAARENEDAIIAKATGLDVGNWNAMTTLNAGGVGSVDGLGEDDLKTYYVYPDVGMSATSVFGFVNTSMSTPSQPPPLTCLTGNCTWSTYSSLGICSTCIDISEHIVTENKLGMPDESVFSQCHDATSTFMGNYTNYVVPYDAGRRLLIQEIDDSLGNESFCPGPPLSRVGLSAVFQPNKTYGFARSETLLVAFAILELPQEYWDGLVTFKRAKAKATECALQLCAQVHEGEVRDGVLNESVISTSVERGSDTYMPMNTSTGSQAIDGVFGNSLSSLDLKAFKSPTWTDNGAVFITEYIIERHDLQVLISHERTYPEGVQRTFNVTQKSITSMMSYFAKNSTLESITIALSASTHIPTTFDTAARLISNRMREIDGTVAVGVSEQWIVYIRVRWDFFILPVVVSVAGYLFTFGAMWDSARLKLETMKGDSLPTLLHGLNTETRSILRDEKVREGKCTAKVWVRLEDDADGLSLHACN